MRASGHLCITYVCLAALAAASGADARAPGDSAQAKAKLAAVRARISTLTNRLGDELKQRDAESARLRQAELGVTAKRQNLDTIRAAESAAQRHRAELESEEERGRHELDAERTFLAGEVRAAYEIGRQQDFKLLLSQSNPATFGRTLAYYAYFAQERSARIEEIQRNVQRVAQLVGDIEQETAKLRALEGDAAREMTALEAARTERADAVAALTKRVASGSHELADLKREEQAVESLVADLERVLQDYPVDSKQSFAAMRGKLPWPIAGRVVGRYQEGMSSGGAGPKLPGETIEGTRGAKVRAPYFGRVVYADWLQGLGLLMIIAHSGGYMTLYGHAEVLYKSVGDSVAPGDVIAGLSETAAAAPQLYFEIREGRKTVDPRLWLRPSP
ncbi:MAG TPA: peptidoglycan DD-metalloendopeptidase family protein [Steroidobacteraceae bacterium]|nr:peptidoglycan DD-metalloendopeptidase family protein [Steroidobacteraceae bacterium]